MRLPTLDAWNFSVQRQLTPTIALEAGYVGNKGTHMFAGEGPDYNFNSPTLVGFCGAQLPGNPCPQGLSTDQRKPFFSKFGWTQGFRYFGNDADNHYNSLQTKVEKRFGNGYSVLAHYTYAHAKNHESAYYNVNRNLWYGRPDWQRNHVVVVSFVGELPFGRGKAWLGSPSKALDLAVGGWEITANTTLMSGLGFNTSYAECGADNDIGSCHPDRIGSTSVSNPSQTQWYKPATTALASNGDVSGPWRRPQPGTFGNDVRNSLTGPRWFQTDLAVLKNFHVTERFQAQFRAEAFNFFNQVNLGNPDGCVDCSTGGHIFGIANNAIMRRLQFALRVSF
jgi:hypothetical protein